MAATAPLLGASRASAAAFGGGAHRIHRAGGETPSTSARRTRSAHQSVIDELVEGKRSHQARQERRATAPFLGAGRVRKRHSSRRRNSSPPCGKKGGTVVIDSPDRELPPVRDRQAGRRQEEAAPHTSPKARAKKPASSSQQPARPVSPENPPKPRIALLEFFAGIRGASKAFETLPTTGVGKLVVECNPYLNEWAKVRWPHERLMTDVPELDQETVSNFLATLPAHDMVLIVAGFPCKDLSRLKTGCKNLDGKHSKLFYQLPRIREIAVKVSIVPVRFLVENVVCDEEAMMEITKELGTRPCRISASTVSATNRDRLYWADSAWSLKSGEEESKNNHFTTIKPKQNAKRLDFLKEGSKFSDSFKGRLPCITGFRRAEAPPRHPAGLESAS